MFNRIINKWRAVLVVVIFIAGCVPEDSIRWNSDGSIGVYRIDGDLGLIVEASGQTIPLDEGEFALWPDISPDGTMICYVKVQKYTDFEQAKAQLPPDMLAAVEEGAGKVLAGFTAGVPLSEQVSRTLGDDETAFPEWVQRYIYERWKGTYQFSENDTIDTLHLSEFILCTTTAPYEKKVLLHSFDNLGFTQFSPDGRMIGYVACRNGFSFNELYVLSLEDTSVNLQIDDNTGVFFDWRGSGDTLCYIRSEADASGSDGSVLGTLCERNVIDEDGKLIITRQEHGTAVCGANRDERAGLLFSPFIKVQYGPAGRIFFSSAKLTVPAGKLDEPQWSLFCYDAITGAVSCILPPDGDVFSANDLTLFSLSPDGTKILLPHGGDRVVLYDLAKREFCMIVGEKPDGKEEDKWPTMVPAWKGNDTVSCAFIKQQDGQESTGLGIYNLEGELIKEAGVEP